MSVERFLKQRAVSVAVDGNYTLPIGRVTRTFNDGFAVQFVETYRQSDLTRLISRESAPGRTLREDAAEEAVA